MVRATYALAGLLALATPTLPDVDAVTFVKAFQSGQADQFKNRQVSGSGVSFHGAISERVADGRERTSLVVTLGATSSTGEMALLNAWDDFVAAERARTTVVVALSGPDLPSRPTPLRFSGVYDGQVRTIMRVPQAGGGSAADSGPCPGEQPRDPAPGAAFYCAPLLTGATATVISR
jgi:hypothetical protein